MPDYSQDERVVMTLDAGGTNLRFSAMRGGTQATQTISFPSNAHDLRLCLQTIITGFEQIRDLCPRPPSAISFAFPGPADYPRGIIGDLGNLPGFRGGVALGPMLERKFGIPVFINNDGDLFAYGESIAGFLPQVNALLEQAGSPKRFQNLLGVTFGTGFGGGIVRRGELFFGDNSLSAEMWLMRNKLFPSTNVEHSVSIRAVRRAYAAIAGLPLDKALEPRDIFEIGQGVKPGNRAAAVETFRQLGEVAGNAIAEAVALVDGLVVIGGGISGAWPLFLPVLVDELNASYSHPHGGESRRLSSRAFNLEDPDALATFLRGDVHNVKIPGSEETISYDPLPRIGVGVSRLGTSESVAMGAYAFALQEIN